MALRKSGEDYLEAILVIGKRKPQVRSIDVANELGFSKPSVSRAMSLLKDGGFITVERDGSLILTEIGKEKAEDVYSRHCLLTEFFRDILGVSEESSAEDGITSQYSVLTRASSALTPLCPLMLMLPGPLSLRDRISGRAACLSCPVSGETRRQSQTVRPPQEI